MEMENNYSVYVHICPHGETYFGMTNNVDRRWGYNGYAYKGKMKEAIDTYGWENILHCIMIDGATKEEAIFIEGLLIDLARERGVLELLNERRSGGCWTDEEYVKEYQKEYNRQYYQDNIEKCKAHHKQYYQDNIEKFQVWNKEWREQNTDYFKEYDKERNSTPARKIYQCVRNYNKTHTPIETPLEAKQKFLDWGYIPDYIKKKNKRDGS